jgi:REP element-mobilizing transposase RayT
LHEYDYARGGAYFVTVCAGRRGTVFGTVAGGAVALNELGIVVARCLDTVPDHHRVRLDSAMVMPDHVHAIVVLLEDGVVALSTVVGTFKAAVTRTTGRRGLWQRGFHDHVIRDEADLDRVRRYIAENPVRWRPP